MQIPVVADIHFDYRLAIAAMENGADKIRINPGNIGSTERVKAVVDVAKERNIPIRVGVNSGSLEKNLVEKTLAAEGPAICEVFVSMDQNFEPKSSAKRLPDGTMVSPPLEDLSPFLPDEEMDENMIIPRIKG